MYALGLDTGGRSLRSALFLGAHCDDIEIGCGSTILRLVETNPDLEITWIIFSSNEVRAQEASLSFDTYGDPWREERFSSQEMQQAYEVRRRAKELGLVPGES